MNSWNRSTSYAHCVKIHSLPHVEGLASDPYDMLCQEAWEMQARNLFDRFDYEHEPDFMVGSNGRSDGYVVLYKSKKDGNRVVCMPGRGIDQNADFEDWDDDDLKERVKLIQDFDRLTVDLCLEFFTFCAENKIEKRTIQVEKEVDCVVPVGEQGE